MYKKIFIAYGVTVIIILMGFAYLQKNNKQNFLYNPIKNLENHIISESTPKEKKIIFLGSSGVLGNNIPYRSTVADLLEKKLHDIKVYNLATMEGTILTAIRNFLHARKYSPSLIILGLSPDNFPLAFHHFPDDFNQQSAILNEISPPTREKLRQVEQHNFSNILSSPLDNIFRVPSLAKIKFFTLLWELKQMVFGPLYSSNIFALRGNSTDDVLHPQNIGLELLLGFIKLTQKLNIELIIYLEPILMKEKVYGRNFLQYREKVTRLLKSHQVLYFDYTDQIPQASEYFIDYIHMTPKGNRLVADMLFKDYVKKWREQQ